MREARLDGGIAFHAVATHPALKMARVTLAQCIPLEGTLSVESSQLTFQKTLTFTDMSPVAIQNSSLILSNEMLTGH